jgi:ribonuclease D
MITPEPSSYILVTDSRHLEKVCRMLLQATRIAVDTEADSMHHYPEKVCLVQIATEEQSYLIDPLAIHDLSALAPVLAEKGIQKLLHGADYDVRGMNRDYGMVFNNLFDTHLAARVLGLERLGLAGLLEDVLEIEIPKDKRIQRADWSKRPLDDDALSYAVGDVVHLFALKDALEEKLQSLGRSAWSAEECERQAEVRYTPPDPVAAVFAMKESRGLDGQGLAVLSALYDFRDVQARRLDRPPAYIISAAVMGAIAVTPGMPLDKVPGLSQGTVRRFEREIQTAIRKGVDAPPLQRPAPQFPPRARPSAVQVKRLANLKAWRTAEAKTIKVDPSMIWPMRSLERLAREPGTLTDEQFSTEVRGWQREQFSGSLREALVTNKPAA